MKAFRTWLPLVVLVGCGPHGPSTPKAPAGPIGNTADPSAAAPHEVMATLERTACYGTCPIYTLTIYRDGVVEYNGDSYVKTKGKATGQVSADDIAQLDKLFTDAHYFDLKDAYTQYDVTDNPSANTSYTAGGRTKHVEHYYGDTNAPAVLGTIENGIDTIVRIEQWIGTEKERDAENR